MTIDDLQIWNGFEGPEISLLPNGLIGIVWSRLNQRREIFDLVDFVSRQHDLAQFAEVEPAVRGSSCGPVIEIEPINVNDSFHKTLKKSKSRPKAASRPAPKRQG